MKHKFFYLISIIIFLFSCTENIEQPKDYNIKDIKYGTDDIYNRMDLYRTSDETKPVVMLIHGGAWIDFALFHDQLSRSGMADFKDQFLNNGYHVANIDYRLITLDNTNDTNITYENMLDDIKSAIQFLKDNADKYAINTKGIALYGYSAGGHLALLYSYKVYDSPIPVKLVVSRAGPSNFRNSTFRNCDFSSMLDPSIQGSATTFIQSILDLPSSTSEEDTYDYCKLALMTELLGIDPTTIQMTKPISEILDDLIADQKYTSLDDGSPIYHVNSKTPNTIMLYSQGDNLVNAALADELKIKLDSENVPNEYFKLTYSTHSLDDSRDSTKIKEFNDAVIKKADELLK